MNDWVHGVRSAAPDKETKQSLEREPLSEAERLRIVNRLITNPEDEGGAGITAKRGEWENVESIFALHDHAYNKAWVKRWSTKWLLNVQDLDEIRNRLGESVCFVTDECYILADLPSTRLHYTLPLLKLISPF